MQTVPSELIQMMDVCMRGCSQKWPLMFQTLMIPALDDMRLVKGAQLVARWVLCRYPREIPELPWYRHTVPQMVMAGFLPFSAIYIEL